MIYHLLNDDRIYTHDTNSDPKKEYYNKKYSDDQILAINVFKRNILSFISEFNIKNYKVNNDKNDVINISNNKKYLEEKDEQWIQDECLINSNLL